MQNTMPRGGGRTAARSNAPACFQLDHFGFDKFALLDSHKATLRAAADSLYSRQTTDRPIVAVKFTGHTDPKGDDLYNHTLGTKRAQAAAEYFMQYLASRYGKTLRAPIVVRIESRGEWELASAKDNSLNRRVTVCGYFGRPRTAPPPRPAPMPTRPGAPPPGSGPVYAQNRETMLDEILAANAGEWEFENYEDELYGETAGGGCGCKSCGGQREYEYEYEYEFEGGESLEMEFEAGKKQGFRFVKKFGCTSTAWSSVQTRLGGTITLDEVKGKIDKLIGVAVYRLRKAAASLEQGKRTDRSRKVFRKYFRVAPEFVPTWRKPTDPWKDRGELVAMRLKAIANRLAGGHVEFFCSRDSCGGPSSAYAWGYLGKNGICFDDGFWDDLKAGTVAAANSMISTLIHEPFHNYFGKELTDHPNDPDTAGGGLRGKFSDINCFVAFTFEMNYKPVPKRVSDRCGLTPVRR